MFKRNKTSGPGATPATPKLGSISLPLFGGGRGYESDSFTKATFHKRTTSLSKHVPSTPQPKHIVPSTPPSKPVAPSTPSSRGSATKSKVFALPEASFRSRKDSTSSDSKPVHSSSRSRTSSISGPTQPIWSGTPILKPKIVDAPWASSTSSSSSWGESQIEKARPRTSSLSSDSCFKSAHCSGYESSGGSSIKSKVKDLKPVKSVNVSTAPMKQEPPSSVHWTLIPYVLRKQHSHPPLLLDLSSDLYHNKDNLCFLNTYPRRPLVAKDLDKTACDVETMIIKCDDLPKWASWHVAIHASKGSNRIRCGDVFEEIHRTFNQRLIESELALVTSKDKRYGEEAYELRCKNSGGLTAWNRKQGLRRVDLLRGKTFFNGLTFDEKKAIWILHLSRTPVT